MTKLVIFDIDGTLTNTKTVEDKCFIQAFEQIFDFDISAYKWEDLQNVTDWGIIEEIIQKTQQREATAREYASMQQHFFELLRIECARDKQQFQEVAGAKHFFDKLRISDQFAIGIATGSWSQSARIKLQAICIDPKGIPFSNSDFFKSRARITQHAIEQAETKHQTKFKDIIYFGDGAWDFKTCKELGIRFIGIDVAQDGKLKALGADIVFEDFRDIAAILSVL